MKSNKAFTLIELLITIAIIAILGSATVLVLNPVEMMSQARDSQRVNDLGVIKKAVDLSIFNNSSITTGTAQRVYLSLPSATAPACDASGLPTLPSGWQYVCSSATNLTKIDGTGWLPINFTSTATPAITSLPIDPINSITGGKYYTYVTGGSYELTAVMESDKENRSAVSDGGSLPGVLQVGTHIDLTPPLRDKGLVGYWGFEGTGSIINGQTSGLEDSSGGSNNGSALNPDGINMSFVDGKKGNAINFDGVNDTVVIGVDNYNINFKEMSIAFWINTNTATPTTYGMALHRNDGNSIGSSIFFGGVETGSNILTATIGANVKGWTAGKTTIAAVPGTWYHIVCSWDGTTARVYIDGVEQLSYAFSASSFVNKPATTRLGSSANSSGYLLNGKVDDARLYDRALSKDEILAIYNATR